MSQTGEREDVHQHSGWLIPAGLFAAIVLLSGLFLGWYLRPGPKAPASPSAASGLVRLTVRGAAFAIPANYIESAPARTGGELDSLTLAALFPSWRGYSDAEARLFQGNSPDSPVVRLTLRGDPNDLDPAARLARIYMPYIAGDGVDGPYGLTQYGFRKASGYARNDLFAGTVDSGLVLLLCERPSPDLPSPNCLAIDRPLARNLSLSYRFKRAYLAHWREVSAGVNGLVQRLRR